MAPAKIPSEKVSITTSACCFLLFLVFSSAKSCSMAATMPTSFERPPVTTTLPSAPTARTSCTRRPAMLRWMPRKMSEVLMPRATMLITSVSASTAQMLETFSGLSLCC